MSKKEILKQFLNWKETKANVFIEIHENEPISVNEIAKNISKDRTTIQKIINNLIDENYILRRQENMERGYKFVYYATDIKEELKEVLFEKQRELAEMFKEWNK